MEVFTNSLVLEHILSFLTFRESIALRLLCREMDIYMLQQDSWWRRKVGMVAVDYLIVIHSGIITWNVEKMNYFQIKKQESLVSANRTKKRMNPNDDKAHVMHTLLYWKYHDKKQRLHKKIQQSEQKIKEL